MKYGGAEVGIGCLSSATTASQASRRVKPRPVLPSEPRIQDPDVPLSSAAKQAMKSGSVWVEAIRDRVLIIVRSTYRPGGSGESS